MKAEEIRARIKQIIADVAFLEVADIGDDSRFVEDLSLDSLSLLEIGVEVDYEYKLGVPDERLKELRSVQDAVDLVEKTLKEKAGSAGAA